jgi:hypothetical protein
MFSSEQLRQPQDRRHHPDIPGFWLHPVKGAFPLKSTEHHSEFFLAHPELFGKDLDAAFEDGWVSVRRWIGHREEWGLRYENLDQSRGLLQAWAADVLSQYPNERLIPLRCFPGAESSRLQGTLEDLARGTVAVGPPLCQQDRDRP